MTDERGILGNLPRERPGRRSELRSTPDEAPAPPRGSSGTSAKARSEAPRTAAAPKTGDRTSASSPRARRAPARGGAARTTAEQPRGGTGTRPAPAAGELPIQAPTSDGPDLLTGAARAAGGVAVLGLRAASRLAGETIRRLPKP